MHQKAENLLSRLVVRQNAICLWTVLTKITKHKLLRSCKGLFLLLLQRKNTLAIWYKTLQMSQRSGAFFPSYQAISQSFYSLWQTWYYLFFIVMLALIFDALFMWTRSKLVHDCQYLLGAWIKSDKKYF